MTDQITVSRELLRQLQSLCMEVRNHFAKDLGEE